MSSWLDHEIFYYLGADSIAQDFITSGQIRLHQTLLPRADSIAPVWCNRNCPEVIKKITPFANPSASFECITTLSNLTVPIITIAVFILGVPVFQKSHATKLL